MSSKGWFGDMCAYAYYAYMYILRICQDMYVNIHNLYDTYRIGLFQKCSHDGELHLHNMPGSNLEIFRFPYT